jgi:hypothetical protein
MPKRTKGKTITIASVIDVVGSLATDSLEGQVYCIDTNKANGSSGQGTDHLRTVVRKGDRLVWTVIFLECEAYAAIDDIIIDSDCCKPEQLFYDGTDVSYWTAVIDKDVASVPYSIKFRIGTRAEPLSTGPTLSLCGPSNS